MKFVEYLIYILGDKILKRISYQNGFFLIEIKKNHLIFFFHFIKNHFNMQFKTVSELTCVDKIKGDDRFELHYVLLSYIYNYRMYIVVKVADYEFVPSIVPLYKGVNWLEREVWDMFGIFFSNHPDLRKILTDYGFSGHPLRKDFPLTGYIELRYDDSKKRVVYENIEITQEFRSFNFLSPWEQIRNFKVG